MSQVLAEVAVEPELVEGARNAVSVCLRIQPEEKVTLITDQATLAIARALTAEIERAKASYRAWILEDVAPRPLGNMPQPVLADLETSQVSIFAAQAQANELGSRMQMTEVVSRRAIRHAHMVNITRQIMQDGMRADFHEVDRISLQVMEITRAAAFVRAKTPAGTDLTAEMNPNYKWLKTSGIISANTWGNLPGGEVWTTPGEVNGTFVVDGVVGDYLCAKYGDLHSEPLTIRIERNRLTEAHCANRALEDEFWRYTHSDENSDRVGEFAIGTNIGVRDVIGNILQDEKIPGVHIAFGDPYGGYTGAPWRCSTHIDVVGRKFDIWVDDRVIMRGGEFVLKRVIAEYRARFNAGFTPQKYALFLNRLEAACHTPVGFRNCETPCFFPASLVERLASDGSELIHQLNTPEYRALSRQAVPPKFDVPGAPDHPLFLQVDFGLVREPSGEITPRLVEIQAFPSLYAYQPTLSRMYIEAYGLDPHLGHLLSGLDPEGYRRELGRAIVGAHHPENVILMEIDPLHQKTLADFLLTEEMLGVRAVSITAIQKEGRRLYYERDGRRIPIERIYNRTIVDELERRRVVPPFDFREALDVEWAGHPNDYFRISKFSIPYLHHRSVPKTWFLDRLDSIPADTENYVLKPLFSFAGLGVRIGPTRQEVAAIPVAERLDYILQERVNFEPVIDTPCGKTRAEIRVMYIWLDELRPVSLLVRMGRGSMMGVDHNKNMEWVGASAGLCA